MTMDKGSGQVQVSKSKFPMNQRLAGAASIVIGDELFVTGGYTDRIPKALKTTSFLHPDREPR